MKRDVLCRVRVLRRLACGTTQCSHRCCKGVRNNSRTHHDRPRLVRRYSRGSRRSTQGREGMRRVRAIAGRSTNGAEVGDTGPCRTRPLRHPRGVRRRSRRRGASTSGTAGETGLPMAACRSARDPSYGVARAGAVEEARRCRSCSESPSASAAGCVDETIQQETCNLPEDLRRREIA